MAGVLKVDTDTLRELDSSLRLIVTTLDTAGGMSRSTADACGDGDLAGVLIDFADDWEDTREDMLDAVRSISDAVHMISSAFDEVDGKLLEALEKAMG
ncbi:hypothetical protein [Herbiconiux sp. UC225_62]|uniref:hypothetical protein n=1 Tax=Herbiconiux sp. UC225_62 TaxID=3350168 RepID=UPI0036D2A8D9